MFQERLPLLYVFSVTYIFIFTGHAPGLAGHAPGPGPAGHAPDQDHAPGLGQGLGLGQGHDPGHVPSLDLGQGQSPGEVKY